MTQSERPGPRLEVCVEDVAGLNAAIAGGADRIELCSALSVGGLTPSVGFMKIAAQSPVPVHALIRPRAGDFHYTSDELRTIRADIEAARLAGISGIVIGALSTDRRLDEETLREMVKAAGGMALTLNRAFDLVADPKQALEQAIALGFTRILTSGCAVSVPAGEQILRDLAAMAKGRIGILPGGGVTAGNAGTLLSIPGINELHASCRSIRAADEVLRKFGFSTAEEPFTDSSKVRDLKNAMLAARQ